MRLTSERLILTPLNSSDMALFIELSTCPVMMAHVYMPFSYAEAQAAFEQKSQPWSLESDGWLSLSIADIDSNEKLGNIGLKIIDHQHKVAEVGFMIKPSAQGKGIAGEALKLVKEFASSELALNKLQATCATENVGSYKVLEKSGFVREKTLSKNTLINDKYVDDYLYGLSL